MEIWKSDWPVARRALAKWWRGQGLALHVTAPAERPWAEAPACPPPRDPQQQWADPLYRLSSQMHRLSRTFHGGVAYPSYSVDVGGPGSLGLFLGSRGRFAPETVWYEPNIADPEAHPPLVPDLDGPWWRWHMEAIDAGLEHAPGRWLVGMPDLIENLDTLAQLRGAEPMLYDLVERPAWVEQRLEEINQAFFTCYDALYERIRDEAGGSSFHAFAIWGPGRTAKLQCDLSCAVSPAMFRRFVVPPMQRQCAWLDFALYHLDGTQALPQLDNLLAMEGLHAIEWTPQAGLPGGGSPMWYDLYRRIRAGGKCVQAIGVAYDEVEPLIDAVGADGLFVMTSAPSEAAARALLERAGWPAD